MIVRRVAVAACLAIAITSVSCGSQPRNQLTSQLEKTDSGTVLALSAGPTAVGNGGFAVETATQDLRVGGLTSPFEKVADVRSLPHGEFAVLDRGKKAILVFDSLGILKRSLGREGDGPGEFRGVRALTPFGNGFLVWQVNGALAFTRLDSLGKAIATATPPVSGDWTAINFREPADVYDGRQSGPEDVTRRLAQFGDSSFVHELAINENPTRQSYDELPTYLIRYDSHLKLVDTLIALRGAPSIRQRHLNPRISAMFVRPMYAPKPVWAVGQGWWAVAHGDSAHVVVKSLHGEDLFTIRWPGVQPTVTQEDKIAFATGTLKEQLSINPSFAKEWSALSKRTRKVQISRYAATHPEWFSLRAGEVTALRAGARCLFIAGHHPSDYLDGTSLTWLVVDVPAQKLLGAVRFPGQGLRVRDISDRYTYVSHFDEDGSWILERYRFDICNHLASAPPSRLSTGDQE